MGQVAATMNDRVNGTCAVHLVPSASGTQPAGPLPFSAVLVQGLATSVMIAGKPAAVVGSSGYNTPPHPPGLTDPAGTTPTLQMTNVVGGSSSVLFEGKPAARTGDSATLCTGVPAGTVLGTAATVMIGG